jgi:hypothetical protein
VGGIAAKVAVEMSAKVKLLAIANIGTGRIFTG